MTPRINDNGIDRDMTTAEIAVYEQAAADAQAEAAARQAAADAHEAARVSGKVKLTALGLTEAEVNAIIGGI